MTAEPSTVRYERRRNVAVITLNHPPVNALSASVWQGLDAAFDQLRGDESVNCAILTADGQKAFCAGADIAEMDTAGIEERSRYLHQVLTKINDTPLPVICAINGPVIGGGIVLSALCDYRIAAEEAIFQWTEIDRGTVSGGGAHMRRLGVAEATIREWLFSGRRFSAAEALSERLIDKIVPFGELSATVLKMAGTWASKARIALMATKQAMLTAEVHGDWREGYAATKAHVVDLRYSEEAKEGRRAFLEKREPNYSL